MIFNSARFPHLRPRLPALLLCIAVLFASPAMPGMPSELEQQRQLFTQVIEVAERGDWSAFRKLPAADQQRLRQYVLWPDLRAAYLQKRLANVPVADIEAFLDQHGSLR
ncbi:MAG: hypothetical protein HKN64_08110, partial [Woeseiaceae bacterium]|nr:hypothetical protein [Woeseiaceae bacterium]